MSRVLGQLLGANQVSFRQQVQQLERAAGLPSADIRLATHIMQATRQKVRELGLDPADTTGSELFAALQARLRQDEIRIRASLNLRADIHPVNILENVAHHMSKLDHHSDLLVVKQTVMKQMLKKLKPKATMKRLGYRSMDSMLKHEPVPQLLAACQISESADWQEMRLTAYKKLQAKDFESKRPVFVVPTTKQWPKFAEAHISQYKHNILVVPEQGAVILLPMSHDLPGMAITSLVLSLHSLNDMRARSAYLKLQQVQPNFGELFQAAIIQEPMTETELGGRALSWHAIHWLYGQGHMAYRPEVFEPHIQPEDLLLHDVGSELASIHPVLTFWQETEALGLLDGNNAVSLNVLDVALGVCNGFGYGERVLHNMRESIGRELFGRYVRHDRLQDMLASKLGQQLTPELSIE